MFEKKLSLWSIHGFSPSTPHCSCSRLFNSFCTGQSTFLLSLLLLLIKLLGKFWKIGIGILKFGFLFSFYVGNPTVVLAEQKLTMSSNFFFFQLDFHGFVLVWTIYFYTKFQESNFPRFIASEKLSAISFFGFFPSILPHQLRFPITLLFFQELMFSALSS